MAKGYVPIFFDWLDTTQDLSAEEKGNLIDAVVSYAAGLEYEHLLCGACKIAFRFLKGAVDRNAQISDVRRQAREGKRQQDTTNDNKQQQNESNSLNNNYNKNNNKNKNENKNNCDPRKRFTPPTVAEVAAYCKERGNGINPEYFVDYYAARGWVLSNGKQAKDWRACVRTWENRAKEMGKKPTKTVIAQQYEQRDYTGVQGELSAMQDLEMEEYMRTANG